VIKFPPLLGPDGRPFVIQQLTHPAVYLDTWALRLFAEDDPVLGARFRNALHQVHGTLVISSLNVAEFTFDVASHARAVGAYIDTLYPLLFFSHFDPFYVIASELQHMLRQTTGSPAGDEGMLELFATEAAQRGRPSVRHWFEAVHTHRSHVRGNLDTMAAAFIKGFEELRLQFHDPQFAKNALRNIESSTRPRATQALLRALMYRMRCDPAFRLSINDALDAGHSIVSAAYCDFVLVDRAWTRRLQDAHRFLQHCRITTKVARGYAKRDEGVLRFLEELEAWPVVQVAAA